LKLGQSVSSPRREFNSPSFPYSAKLSLVLSGNLALLIPQLPKSDYYSLKACIKEYFQFRLIYEPKLLD